MFVYLNLSTKNAENYRRFSHPIFEKVSFFLTPYSFFAQIASTLPAWIQYRGNITIGHESAAASIYICRLLSTRDVLYLPLLLQLLRYALP